LTSALLAALHENGIDADIRTIHDGPRLQSYETVLTDATQLRTLQRARENIEFALARDAITLQSGIEPRRVDIQVPKPRTNWRTVTWSEVSPHLPTTDVAQLGVALGVDPLGIPVSFDLASAPHLLVGGTTGSGKSVCLHALISSLLLGHGPQSMRLCLIDPKQLEFAAYAALPDLWSDEPLVDASTALDALLTLVSEMEQREAALARLGYKQLTEWRRQQRDAPPYLVIVVEELADLLMQRPEVEVPLVRLAQKGRASGIHLILATQRPDSATFSGLLRSNIPSRIALTVQKAAESRIILDETGAEHLLGQGDMLLKLVGQDVRRVHGAAITSVDIDAAIRTARNRN
ncbi:MAG TPA: FtsK/SpoIIIE domain-containing protein, partial [Accumulibacter sp.]|nr:FtsK/SpoIIIE domain-containing protein [Accumulibacter sp.]